MKPTEKQWLLKQIQKKIYEIDHEESNGLYEMGLHDGLAIVYNMIKDVQDE